MELHYARVATHVFNSSYQVVENASSDIVLNITVAVTEESFRNVSHDNATTDAHEGRHLAQAVVMGALMSAIALISLVGNVLVILAVATNKRLRTITNYYVASLATSDLCVSLFVLPLSITVETTGRWMFGIIVCEVSPVWLPWPPATGRPSRRSQSFISHSLHMWAIVS